MDHLYIDNFRNFFNTSIPIKKFNFLVGENSSGKTSILTLMQLLCSFEFWNTGKFFDGFVDVRLFSDLVNPKFGKEYFTIGIYDPEQISMKVEKPRSSSKKNIKYYFMRALMMKFKNSQGVPMIERINLIAGDYFVTIVKKRKVFRYGYKKIKGNNFKKLLADCINVELPTTEKLRRPNIVNLLSGNNSFENVSLHDVILRTANLVLRNEVTESENTRVIFNTSPGYGNFVWISPIRTQPERTYDRYHENYSPEGKHTPYELNFNLRTKTFRDQINKFGNESGLFEELLKISKGKEKYSPFQLNVKLNKLSQNIINVGYGVSQILPILNELLKNWNEINFAIQQPEVHLHPKAQTALGKLFYKINLRNDCIYFVETHSDFIIDSYRYEQKISKTNEQKPAQILFFKRGRSGNKVYAIDIENNGSISEKQHPDYRKFFINESIKLLALNL